MTNKVHDTYLFDYSFSTPIQVKTGDILKSTCVFKSTGRAKTVFYGDGTNDEMCLGFLRFYPKQNVPLAFCVSFKELDQRALFTSQEYRGCRHWDFLLSLSEEARQIKSQVTENCQPLRGCLTECQSIVSQVKQHACMAGDVGSWIKNHALYGMDQRVNRVEMEKFYLALTSCDEQFNVQKIDSTNSNSILTSSKLALSICIALYMFIFLNFVVY